MIKRKWSDFTSIRSSLFPTILLAPLRGGDKQPVFAVLIFPHSTILGTNRGQTESQRNSTDFLTNDNVDT